MPILAGKEIILSVSPDIAELYEKSSTVYKKKVAFMFEIFLWKSQKPFFLCDDLSWDEKKLDEVRDRAAQKGLTPEILEEILNEK